MANVQCFLDTLFLVQLSLVPIVMATGLPSHIRYLSVIIRYVWAVGFHTCYTQGPRIFCLRLLILLCGYQHPFPAISPQPCSIPRSFQFGETCTKYSLWRHLHVSAWFSTVSVFSVCFVPLYCISILNDFQELKKLRGWIDGDPKLFAADVLLSLLLSYRDIQVQQMCLVFAIYMYINYSSSLPPPSLLTFCPSLPTLPPNFPPTYFLTFFPPPSSNLPSFSPLFFPPHPLLCSPPSPSSSGSSSLLTGL